MLVIQNRELAAQLNTFVEAAESEQSTIEATLVGMNFPSGPLRNAEAQPFDLASSAPFHGTLLFVSSPHCDLCTLAAPIWKQAAADLSDSGLRIYGLILETALGDLQPDSYPYPVLAPEDSGVELFRHLEGVPAAVFLDSRGVIQRVLYGDNQHGLSEAALEFLAAELSD